MSSNSGYAKNSLKKSLTGAVIFAAVGTVAYWLYNKNQGSGSKFGKTKSLSKANTIKVLKQLKKELFTPFTTMSMMAQQIKAQTRGRASEAEVREFVTSHPQIAQELKSSEERAYKRFNVTQQEFEYSVQQTFKDDAEIQQLRREIKESFDKSSSGLQIDIKTTIPQSLTSDNTLQIIEEIMKASCKKIQETFQQLSEDGGQVNMNDPSVLRALNNMSVDNLKSDILAKYELDQYDDPAAKILQYATTKYQQENTDGFQEKMMQLEMKHRRSMELITQKPHDNSIIDSTFSQEIRPPTGPGGMFGMNIGNRTKKDGVEKVERAEESKNAEGEQKAEQQQQNQEKKPEEESVEIIKKTEQEQQEQQEKEQPPIDIQEPAPKVLEQALYSNNEEAEKQQKLEQEQREKEQQEQEQQEKENPPIDIQEPQAEVVEEAIKAETVSEPVQEAQQSEQQQEQGQEQQEQQEQPQQQQEQEQEQPQQ